MRVMDATMTFLLFLMQRRASARLLVIGTYRPEAIRWQPSLLQQRLQAMRSLRRCFTLDLNRLCREDVVAFTEAHLGGEVTDALATLILDRTAGHPLCIVHLLNEWQQHGWLWQRDDRWGPKPEAEAAALSTPPRLRQQIMRQIRSLTSEMQEILKAASVAEEVFEAVTLADCLQMGQDVVERSCQEIADTTLLLETVGMAHWCDTTVSGQYRFRHGVYRQVIAEHQSAWEWTQLHAQVRRGAGRDMRPQADGIWKSWRPF